MSNLPNPSARRPPMGPVHPEHVSEPAVPDMAREKPVFSRSPSISDAMKAKIMQINADTSLSAQEKTKRVQAVLTARWTAKVAASDPPSCQCPSTPLSKQEEIRNCSPVCKRDGGPTREELTPSFHTTPSGQRVMGCQHYQRSCKLRAKCCGAIFPCRFCHDEATGHTMDRYATEEMLCMHCGTLQKIAATCNSALCRGRTLAAYFCSACKFFDDDATKDIYHCPHCNICRIGKGLGIDYFHCMKCNACMSTSLSQHRCVERSLESDCPICHQFMFTSTTPVMFMACGHCMHVSCFESYASTNYTCPICSKSLGDMSSYFARLDAHLMAERMPPEFANMTSLVFCCDCEQRSTVPFHFVYHKCASCNSYNTKVLSQSRPVSPPHRRDAQ